MKLSLKQARVGAGMSQEQMAEKLGVSTMTYNGYEKNPNKMRVDKVIAFVRATGVDISMLKLEG